MGHAHREARSAYYGCLVRAWESERKYGAPRPFFGLPPLIGHVARVAALMFRARYGFAYRLLLARLEARERL